MLQCVLYKLITIRWRRTPIIPLLIYIYLRKVSHGWCDWVHAGGLFAIGCSTIQRPGNTNTQCSLIATITKTEQLNDFMSVIMRLLLKFNIASKLIIHKRS